MHPNEVGDVDGAYMGFDGKVHTASDWTPMANFSLWDTYRPQNQLLELLQPKVARDVALSLLAVEREGGWLPRWELVNSETNIMTGDPVTPFLVENWSKGLLAGHEQEAYAAMRRNVMGTPPASSPYNGRNGNPWYTKRGYIPSGENCVVKGGDNDCQHPASATLEYAAADAALSLMAKGLGKDDDAAMFAKRGQNYRNLWDASIGHFRPRMDDGAWMDPYDPATGDDQFHESGAYQYQWLVPQDPAGMIGLLGGNGAANQRLDDFFAYDKLLADPAGTARTEWVNSAYNYYGAKTYNPNNEPDLLSPYTYLWTGQPYKTATVVRAAETLFTNGPDGMTGNDDLGTMSAWYVFSSLGLYPTMSGANFYGISSPQFEGATVQVGDYAKSQGGTLTITRPRLERRRPLHPERDARRHGLLAHLRDAEGHRTRGEARLHRGHEAVELGHGRQGRAAVGRPRAVHDGRPVRAPRAHPGDRRAVAGQADDDEADHAAAGHDAGQRRRLGHGDRAPGLHHPARDRADADPLARPADLRRGAVHGHRPGRHAGGQLPGVGARADGRRPGDHPQRDDPRALRELARARPAAPAPSTSRATTTTTASRRWTTPRRATSTTAGGASRPT